MGAAGGGGGVWGGEHILGKREAAAGSGSLQQAVSRCSWQRKQQSGIWGATQASQLGAGAELRELSGVSTKNIGNERIQNQKDCAWISYAAPPPPPRSEKWVDAPLLPPPPPSPPHRLPPLRVPAMPGV